MAFTHYSTESGINCSPFKYSVHYDHQFVHRLVEKNRWNRGKQFPRANLQSGTIYFCCCCSVKDLVLACLERKAKSKQSSGMNKTKLLPPTLFNIPQQEETSQSLWSTLLHCLTFLLKAQTKTFTPVSSRNINPLKHRIRFNQICKLYMDQES